MAPAILLAGVGPLVAWREGDAWREGLAEEARQELANAGIFYDVTVTPEPSSSMRSESKKPICACFVAA